MQIQFLEYSEINDLYAFNKQVFPTRHEPNSIIDFWFSKNTDERNLSVILNGASDEIWGQALFSSMNYFFNSELYKGKWCFDYIVREDKRKDGYGIDIMQFALESNEIPIFATGSGPIALKIELKMGFKLLGELKKYAGIVNPIYFLSSFFRGTLAIKRFPSLVKTKGATFSLITKENLFDIAKPYNENLLEFGRDKSFLNWRFYSSLHDYAVYKNDTGDDYFVLRTIVKKHITCMVLVDYRCNVSTSNNFGLILKAAKQVTCKLRLCVLIIGSSLRSIDAILEKQYFRAIGRHRPIITTKSVKEYKASITNREFVLTTLADSDGEIQW